MTMDFATTVRPLERLLAGLNSVGQLSDDEIAVLADLPFRIHEVSAHQDIAVSRQRSDHCSLIVDGALCRYKLVSRGQRQILSFHFPGELPDLQALQFGASDFSMSAIVASRIARISHAALHDALRRAPGLNGLFWRLTAQDAAIARETIASIGRRPAYERVAHFICELYLRLRALGLAANDRLPLPLRQTDLADALGLSAVHINRTMQQLRRDNLIMPRGRHLAFENWSALKKAAAFDPGYLFLSPERSDEPVNATQHERA